MRNFTIPLTIIALTFTALACSSSSGESAGAADEAADTASTDNSDGTSGTDEDGTGGADGTTGIIPDCNFKPPVGATCNPYPACPGSGCASGQLCTLVEANGSKRIECAEAGGVALGGACSATESCAEGLCVEGECRSFCVDSQDCPNSTCTQLSGVPGKPTICGAAVSGCDPLDASNSCPPGTACYLSSTLLSDCKEIQGTGQAGSECNTAEDCGPGLTCTGANETSVCGPVCATSADHPMACGMICTAMQVVKQLDETYSVCVPQGQDPVDPPPADPCDILAQDCMGAAQACYPTNQGTVCLAKGNKAPGADCSGSNDCEPGAFCFSNGKCYRVCDPKDPLNSLCESGANANCVDQGGWGYCDE